MDDGSWGLRVADALRRSDASRILLANVYSPLYQV